MQVENCFVIAIVVASIAAIVGLYTSNNFYGGPRCNPGWEEPWAHIVFDACIIALAAAAIMIVLCGVYQEKKSPEGLPVREERELSREPLAENTAQITIGKKDIVEYEERGMPYYVTVEVTRRQRYKWWFFYGKEESTEYLAKYYIPHSVRVVYK